MTFRSEFPDSHELWQLADKVVLEMTTHEYYTDSVILVDIKETDEYVSALGAVSDFLYGLYDLGRLRPEKGEVKTVNYFAVIDPIITGDSDVHALYRDCPREYRYNVPMFSDDTDYYHDLTFMRLCIRNVYATLMEAGYVKTYERQEHTVTTHTYRV